jgi:hypothetical protein
MKNLLVIILSLLFSSYGSGTDFWMDRPIVADTLLEEDLFCMSVEGLFEVKSAIERDDPVIRTSYQKLCEQAEKALVAGPFSVMKKTKTPPSGDKHDYMSVPPYAGTGDGLTNPVWWLDYDRVPLEQLTQSVETLALTYFFTGKQKYTDRAVLLLREWFLNPETRMNPDLEFAQKTTRVGVIDTRFLSRIIDCIGILKDSGVWTAQDESGMKDWCRQFLTNVQNRVDEDHRDSGHNISSWYHVQMSSLALYIGDKELAFSLLDRTKARIDTALNVSGGFKRELNRTRSLSYSCFHIYAMYNLASMGEHLGIDLWNYRTNDGRGLKLALEFLAKFAGKEIKDQWPYQEIEGTPGDWWKPYSDMLPTVLYHAAKIYQNEDFNVASEQILREKLDESLIQIMCGIPVRWFETIDHRRE